MGTSDKILDAFIELVDKDPDMLPVIVNKTERLHVLMIIMAVAHLLKAGEQEQARGYLQACKDDFLSALEMNLEMNLKVNGLTMELSHNEKVAQDILKQMEKE